MNELTSKELFMASGGIIANIYRDGFGDQYRATVAEEKRWTEELIARKWQLLDTETNTTVLQMAIDTLAYHQADQLVEKLTEKLSEAEPFPKAVIAGKLWKLAKFPASFSILQEQLKDAPASLCDAIFWIFNEMTDNKPLRLFLLECLQGNDPVLPKKAHTTVTMWAYTGLPELREGTLLADLNPENKTAQPGEFGNAIKRLKSVLKIEK